MSKLMKAVAILIMTVLVGGTALRAQEKEAPREAPKPSNPSYKVDFVIAEVEDGKRVNTRSYTLMMEEGQQARASASTRVPIATGSFGPGLGGSGVNPLVNTQYQYMDVGTSLTFRFIQPGEYLLMRGGYNIDTFAMAERPDANGRNMPNMPVTRRISSEVSAAILPGKPTIISSVDDTNSKKRYQLEVTATKIK